MKANKFVFSGPIDGSQIPHIKQTISSHEGINAVRLDVNARTVTVDYDEGKYTEGQIIQFVNETGLNVQQVK